MQDETDHFYPADYVSRPLSYNQLKKTNYYTGPIFLKCMPDQPDIELTLPVSSSDCTVQSVCQLTVGTSPDRVVEPLIPLERYSSFSKLVGVYK